MKLLALDTATEACSAALFIDGKTISRYEFAPRRHAELILAMVNDLLAEAGMAIRQLDCLAFGRGPGAFTGVRIAAGVIQGLAFAADLAVVPVSTLAILAQGAIGRSEYLFSAIDARMAEIYWCLFRAENQLVQAVTDEAVSKPDQVTIPGDNTWYGVGSGWKSYREILLDVAGRNLSGHDGDTYPHARDIIPLAVADFTAGRAVPAEQALPVYLRNRVTG